MDEGDGFPTMRYSEGLEVGYRWFQAQGIRPLFPFGHGLSYTSFAIEDFDVSEVETDGLHPLVVSAVVTNTGERAGAEVVQLYVAAPDATVTRPHRELKAFDRVALEPGETGEAVLVTTTDADVKQVPRDDEDPATPPRLINVANALCNSSTCFAEDSGITYYFDDNHLSAKMSRTLKKFFIPSIKEILVTEE